MVRALPFVVLLLAVAAVVAIRPSLPLRWAARLWYVASPRPPSAQVPEWVAYYLWAAPGDPVPRAVASMEESVRTIALLALGVPVVLFLLLLLLV